MTKEICFPDTLENILKNPKPKKVKVPKGLTKEGVQQAIAEMDALIEVKKLELEQAKEELVKLHSYRSTFVTNLDMAVKYFGEAPLGTVAKQHAFENWVRQCKTAVDLRKCAARADRNFGGKICSDSVFIKWNQVSQLEVFTARTHQEIRSALSYFPSGGEFPKNGYTKLFDSCTTLGMLYDAKMDYRHYEIGYKRYCEICLKKYGKPSDPVHKIENLLEFTEWRWSEYSYYR